MKSGLLDRRLVVESYTSARTDTGGETRSWSTFATIWGDPIPQADTEPFEANRKTEQQTFKVRTRYYPGITVNMRISYNSLYYNIESINELGRREGYEMMVKLHKDMA